MTAMELAPSKLPSVRQFRSIYLADLGVLMRDGVRRSLDLYLPDAAGPFPVVLVRTPYDNSDAYYGSRRDSGASMATRSPSRTFGAASTPTARTTSGTAKPRTATTRRNGSEHIPG